MQSYMEKLCVIDYQDQIGSSIIPNPVNIRVNYFIIIKNIRFYFIFYKIFPNVFRIDVLIKIGMFKIFWICLLIDTFGISGKNKNTG